MNEAKKQSINLQKKILKKKVAIRKHPTQKRSKDTVNKILAVTQTLLSSEGTESINTNRVAKEAGLSISSLYEYFPNKETILFTLGDRWLISIRDAISQCDPMENQFRDCSCWINAVINTVSEIYKQQPGLPHLVYLLSTIPELRALHLEHDKKAAALYCNGLEYFFPNNDHDRLLLLAHNIRSIARAALIESLVNKVGPSDQLIADIIFAINVLVLKVTSEQRTN